jgi:hypothetical protein
VTETERQALWRLRTRWLGVYVVTLADDVWRARQYGDATVLLTADTADELTRLIEADYAKVVLPS